MSYPQPWFKATNGLRDNLSWEWLFAKNLLGGAFDQAVITVTERMLYQYFPWSCHVIYNNCIEADEVEKILTVYTNAAEAGTIPPFRWNDQYTWDAQEKDPATAKIVPFVAQHVVVPRERVLQALTELWWGTQDGEIVDGYKILDPRGATSAVYEPPKHVTNLDRTVTDIGTAVGAGISAVGKGAKIALWGALAIGAWYMVNRGSAAAENLNATARAGIQTARDTAGRMRAGAQTAISTAQTIIPPSRQLPAGRRRRK